MRAQISDGVAIYAAVVATATAGWRVYEVRHARKQHVEVVLSYGLLGMTDGQAPEAILIHVKNHGDHSVRVDSVGLELQDSCGRTLQQTTVMPGAAIPGVVQPRDSGMTYFFTDAAQRGGIDPYRPAAAFASLATGERIKSKLKTLKRRSAA